jgi:hypothetical protein
MVDWDDDASAGAWIAERLGDFGPTVDGTVPRGYAAYACIEHPWHDDEITPATQTDALAAVLAPFTGDQPVHLAVWTGHAFLYDHGSDPRATSGISPFISRHPDEPRPTDEEVDRALAEAWDRIIPTLTERPAAPMLLLPHREYHLWTGTLTDAGAFRHQEQPPNLWWPQDRSWFVGTEIDASATYVGGSDALVEAVCADSTLGASRVEPSARMLFDD